MWSRGLGVLALLFALAPAGAWELEWREPWQEPERPHACMPVDVEYLKLAEAAERAQRERRCRPDDSRCFDRLAAERCYVMLLHAAPVTPADAMLTSGPFGYEVPRDLVRWIEADWPKELLEDLE